jgi:hypothetical protein
MRAHSKHQRANTRWCKCKTTRQILMKMKLALRSGQSCRVSMGQERNLVKGMTLMSSSATKYLIYCCRKSISVYRQITCCHHPKSSRGRSGASATIPPCTIPMNAGCSISGYKCPLNNGVSISSKKKQWRIKFDDQKRPMKIDGHPFPMNMIGGSAAPCSHQEV